MANYPVKLLKDKDGTAFIPVVNSDSIITPEGDTLNDLLEEKQDALVSGTNIKTINGNSILGNGDISLAGGETLKVGTILPFSGSTLPTGYLFCDGSAISRTTYAGLFDVIGTTFGAGDGSTTFNLPNLKGRVPVGQDSNDTDFDTLGETGGEKTHTLTTNEMPSHTHTAKGNMLGGFGTESAKMRRDGDAWTYSYQFLNNTGGGQPHNNVQPYVVVNYIIKATQTTPVQAQIVDGYSTSTTDGYSANYINQIIESGTDYIKYYDGTMICYGVVSLQANESRDAGGLTYYSGATDIDFSQSFTSTDFSIFATVGVANMNYFCQSYASPNSVSQIRVSFISTVKGDTRRVSYVAIGKWK